MKNKFRAVSGRHTVSYHNRAIGPVEFDCHCVAVDVLEGEDVSAISKMIRVAGYDPQWLPYKGSDGKRKLFVMGAQQNDGTWASLNPTSAKRIAQKLNELARGVTSTPKAY